MTEHEEPMRTYLCPECGYDGFKAGKVKFSGVPDVAMSYFCPGCFTLKGRSVELVETSDPRSVA